MMNRKNILLSLGLLLASAATGETIDASDPTKIYTFLGGGPKYTDFTTGEYLWEARLIGNLGLSDHDMVLFEAGYGRITGHDQHKSESGWTSTRLRWFHLFEMDYEAIGYRGMGTQVDLQLAGGIRGTDGQNLLVTGVMPTWNFSENLSLYLSLNLVNAWDKRFENYNGAGAGFDAQIIYNNENWWPGAQVRLIPVYNYFLAGELDGEGSGNFDINVGGEFSPTVMWDITYQTNFDKDLNTFRRGEDTDIENDWNLFFNVTSYF
ncbi:MAG: hypothetical protein V7711_18155 [Pseudomonadales bacterium]